MISFLGLIGRYPGGRFRTGGPHSGEEVREDVLVPALTRGDDMVIDLRGIIAYPYTFLEEAFGGLIRNGYITAENFEKRFKFLSDDPRDVEQIFRHVKTASEELISEQWFS
jgi:hypothetical protein